MGIAKQKNMHMESGVENSKFHRIRITDGHQVELITECFCHYASHIVFIIIKSMIIFNLWWLFCFLMCEKVDTRTNRVDLNSESQRDAFELSIWTVNRKDEIRPVFCEQREPENLI